MIVDWSKYKRFFTFGCSFTSYMWPSWADIISKEMPNAEFYNFGTPGSGNQLISHKLTEVNRRYEFTDTDLVMVMFSTYCREDRWIERENGWVTKGNVFSNPFYPDDWVKKYSDERGYLIRDAGILDLTVNYLDNLPCTTYYMLSVPFVTNADCCGTTSKAPSDICKVYEKTFNKFKPSMYELELMRNWRLDYDGFEDGHPATIRYYNYLEKLGFNLSEKTKKFAEESTEILKTIKNRNVVPLYFPEQNNTENNTYSKILF
jgi:hypothetical protein